MCGAMCAHEKAPGTAVRLCRARVSLGSVGLLDGLPQCRYLIRRPARLRRVRLDAAVLRAVVGDCLVHGVVRPVRVPLAFVGLLVEVLPPAVRLRVVRIAGYPYVAGYQAAIPHTLMYHFPSLRVRVMRAAGLHPFLTLGGARRAEVVPRDAVGALGCAGQGFAALEFGEHVDAELGQGVVVVIGEVGQVGHGVSLRRNSRQYIGPDSWSLWFPL